MFMLPPREKAPCLAFLFLLCGDLFVRLVKYQDVNQSFWDVTFHVFFEFFFIVFRFGLPQNNLWITSFFSHLNSNRRQLFCNWPACRCSGVLSFAPNHPSLSLSLSLSLTQLSDDDERMSVGSRGSVRVSFTQTALALKNTHIPESSFLFHFGIIKTTFCFFNNQDADCVCLW